MLLRSWFSVLMAFLCYPPSTTPTIVVVLGRLTPLATQKHLDKLDRDDKPDTILWRDLKELEVVAKQKKGFWMDICAGRGVEDAEGEKQKVELARAGFWKLFCEDLAKEE